MRTTRASSSTTAFNPNAITLAGIGGVAVVCKPFARDKPLWDYPGSCLTCQEVTVYLLPEIVPYAWPRRGPYGDGMAQL